MENAQKYGCFMVHVQKARYYHGKCPNYDHMFTNIVHVQRNMVS